MDYSRHRHRHGTSACSPRRTMASSNPTAEYISISRIAFHPESPCRGHRFLSHIAHVASTVEFKSKIPVMAVLFRRGFQMFRRILTQFQITGTPIPSDRTPRARRGQIAGFSAECRALLLLCHRSESRRCRCSCAAITASSGQRSGSSRSYPGPCSFTARWNDKFQTWDMGHIH